MKSEKKPPTKTVSNKSIYLMRVWCICHKNRIESNRSIFIFGIAFNGKHIMSIFASILHRWFVCFLSSVSFLSFSRWKINSSIIFVYRLFLIDAHINNVFQSIYIRFLLRNIWTLFFIKLLLMCIEHSLRYVTVDSIYRNSNKFFNIWHTWTVWSKTKNKNGR